VLVAVALAVVALNLAALVLGYYVGLRHIDQMLDIEEGSREAEFPPGFRRQTGDGAALAGG